MTLTNSSCVLPIRRGSQKGWPVCLVPTKESYTIMSTLMNAYKGRNGSRTHLNGFADHYLTAWLSTQL